MITKLTSFLPFSYFLTSFIFLLSIPLYSQAVDDYRTASGGFWSTSTIWQRFNGVAWVAAVSSPTSSNGVITIRNTHMITCTTADTVDQVVIEAGGKLDVNATLTVNNGAGDDIIVNGIYNVLASGSITFLSTSRLTFNSGSTYEHARNGGSLPAAVNTTWNANSTCLITGVTSTAPSNLAQTYGNLTYNCPGQTITVNFTVSLTTINGNLTVQNTGTTGIFSVATTSSGTLNIGGNLTITGGTVRTTTTGTRTINVNDNFTLSNGTLNMSSGSAITTLNIKGSLSHTGGTITETSTGSGVIVFNGVSNQSYTSGGTISNTINFTINNSAGITLTASATFPATLTMTSGNITTGANTLSLGTSASNLGTLSRTSGTIIGNFRRWFTTGTVSNVLFPIGTSTNYRPANISFTVAITTGGTLTAFFTATDPGTAGLPLDDGGTSIINAGKEGYWTINAADGLTGGIYSLDLTADGFSGVSDVTTLRIIKRATGGGNWMLDGLHSAGTGTTTTPIVHRTGMSGFSEFGVGGASDNPLPVELSSFSAVVSESGVNLKWRTETEVSNYGFEVQKSEVRSQESEWNTIGFVHGHGNSNSPKDYFFIDQSVAGGKYSYRLKQIDTDGKFEYSKVIEVDLGSPANFELSQNYPNPFNPATTIKFSIPASPNPSEGGALVNLSVYNLLGEEVAVLVNKFLETGVHTINFNAESLPSGIYIYKIEANGYVQSRKMTLIK